ncbi:hypothetical protein [Streptomyces sp. NPDC088915]|uniref:hypothetical protein n=1 Tax=Streptomyces sp. NPDC088915 TaxID=3365912 RepID=UPI003821168C
MTTPDQQPRHLAKQQPNTENRHPGPPSPHRDNPPQSPTASNNKLINPGQPPPTDQKNRPWTAAVRDRDAVVLMVGVVVTAVCSIKTWTS